MQLTVYRHTYNTEGDRNIIGDLFIDGKYFCHTLEDEIREDGVKIYGETCIKADKYKVELTVSNRFKRLMPLLLDVPMFSGIRIHGGNSSKDSLGCILIAFKTDWKRIWQTAEKSLTKKLESADGDIFITIKNAGLSYDRDQKKETL